MIEEFYKELFGFVPGEIEPLAQSGSNRRYYRVYRSRDLEETSSIPESVIYTKGTSVAENSAFIQLSRYFYSMGLPVPNIYGVSEDKLSYFQRDLGNDSLFNHLDNIDLLKKAIDLLPDFQFSTSSDFDYSICYPQSSFDESNIFFDLNYFKYCFLKLTNIEFDEIRLEADFKTLRDTLLQAEPWGFMYRDFQSRNIIVDRNNEPYFIDFQGGRYGPIYYDVASFIWQARAAFSNQIKIDLLDSYLLSLEKYYTIDKSSFFKTLRHFVLFRVLQTLGAYGFRGLYEKKAHFIKSIPFAIKNLAELIKQPFTEYPYLNEVLEKVVKSSSFYPEIEITEPGVLTVEVNSFSYKKGLPEDFSGNGGGFVFDCRSYANPGRDKYYKNMTGRDQEVIDFLESDGGIVEFLEELYPVIDRHILYFISRGFDHAMFSFGCTGGQHRSVYCAERLFEHIRSRFDVRIILKHKELGITEIC